MGDTLVPKGIKQRYSQACEDLEEKIKAEGPVFIPDIGAVDLGRLKSKEFKRALVSKLKQKVKEREGLDNVK